MLRVYYNVMDKVSIITAVYNGERYVEQCVLSLQQQTYQNLEMLFVDDGSTDDSAALLQSFAQADSRIRIISLPQNSGLAHARNVALSKATGAYVCMLDVDDRYSPDAIDSAVTTMKSTSSSVQPGTATSHFRMPCWLRIDTNPVSTILRLPDLRSTTVHLVLCFP